jgi:hypothetical protein
MVVLAAPGAAQKLAEADLNGDGESDLVGSATTFAAAMLGKCGGRFGGE